MSKFIFAVCTLLLKKSHNGDKKRERGGGLKVNILKHIVFGSGSRTNLNIKPIFIDRNELKLDLFSCSSVSFI